MKRNTLLIVDDTESSRSLLRVLFGHEYNILEAENGEQALMLYRQYHNSLVGMLLDIVIPVKDGYEVLQEIAQEEYAATVPLIVVTADQSIENEVKVLELGAADIVTKPFEPHIIKRRVQNSIELNQYKIRLEEEVAVQSARLRESREVLMDALSSVIEHRSIETGQHILRIRMFTKILLQDVQRNYPEYGLDERKIGVIASASALHDIGKIAIPDAILKKPGPLTREEFEEMKTHTTKGCEVLESLDRMDDLEYLGYAYNICRYHHERWDGKGYPEGLRGDSIPICAQAVGVADAFDALTTDRVYKAAYSADVAFTMILNGECGTFPPKLLESLKRVRDQFAGMAHAYADGRSPKSDIVVKSAATPAPPAKLMNSLQLGQQKYQSALRYMEATVVELDADTGVYHLVYQPDGELDSLRFGGLFHDAFRAFVEQSVHPDDRAYALEFMNGYLRDFTANASMKRSRKHRILNTLSREYHWYTATIVRVDPEDETQHKVLVIWKELSAANGAGLEPQPQPAPDGKFNLLAGNCQSLNDAGYTITYINEGFTAMLGYSRAEVQSRLQNHFIELVHPDDRASLHRQLTEQLQTGNRVKLEYRVLTRNGQCIWILENSLLYIDSDGNEVFSSILIDITQSKLAEEELRLTLERHQIIMAQTNDIIFEWDLERDAIFFTSNWKKTFHYDPITTDFSKLVSTASHIHPQDLPRFLKLMRKVSSGRPYAHDEVRIADEEGKYRWFRFRATTQFGNDQKPLKVIGIIVDVDSEKRRTQSLIEKAEQDSLTKLYNKSAALRKVKQMLDNRGGAEQSVMFIVDLDNFKQVNEKQGHLFGDALLVEVAGVIKKLFRPDDIISRIGGDEFLIFMRLSENTSVPRRTQRIVDNLQAKFAELIPDTPLSCSVGIVRCPEDGEDFQTLFQKCDQALYQAKRQGKNRFVLYNHRDALLSPPQSDTVQPLAANTSIESDDAPALDTGGLVRGVLQVLYRTGNILLAVNDILELIGNKFNVSRACIFECSDDDTYCVNTFEWCNAGVASRLGTRQQFRCAELDGDYLENFDENGIFYCPDIARLPLDLFKVLKPQGIRSMLQCAIYNEGKFAGWVGFDDCGEHRMWTQNQIDALTFVSELLSTFLLKKRAQDRAVSMAKDLQNALDHQNSWVYVIDPDTYELLFLNGKTRRISPDAKLGMHCYEAFFHRTQACELCPARTMGEALNNTLEVYNPVLKVWSLADATRIRWQEKEAILLACHDITPYKADRPEPALL